jgi:hypothetical protein
MRNTKQAASRLTSHVADPREHYNFSGHKVDLQAPRY